MGVRNCWYFWTVYYFPARNFKICHTGQSDQGQSLLQCYNINGIIILPYSMLNIYIKIMLSGCAWS